MKDTLQLPRTDFPMRAQLAEREPARLKAWQHMDLWRRIREARQGLPSFVLHDGPPYANGGLHQGHLLNKILKDIIVKDRAMAGFDVSYTPGWDCHGLPIETQVDKSLGGKKQAMSAREVHAACRAWADKFIDVQREGFVRLGVLGDWSTPYTTMAPAYQASIVRAFADLFETELVFRGLRPVHWCTRHQTALAEAEVEYESKRSPSLHVRFAATPGPRFGALAALPEALDIAIWTTTPWSLPGNVAVIVHPDVSYVAVPMGERHVLVAEALLDAFVASLAHDKPKPPALSPQWRRIRGADLVGLAYQHPFLPRTGVVLADPFVSVETGTGLVHAAPAHGQDDFAVAMRAKLPFESPVDARGVLTDAAGPFANMPLVEASTAIIAYLQAHGHLLSDTDASVEHRYAHCWRCHLPIITRATEQWFLSMDKALPGKQSLRTQALRGLQDVEWIPAWGVERIRGMLATRPDWCLSRQRTWGVALPIAYCEQCETPFASPGAMRHAADIVARSDASALVDTPVAELLGVSPTCATCGGQAFRMGTDILDVWFDSGVSWYATLPRRDAAQPPADLYLEGSDQHRGWFHSSLLTSVALTGRPPYARCLTHGFVVDGAGKKISKSKGNFVDPFASIGRDGAEVWRLWAASEDYQQDVRLSPQILKQLSDHYRKLRNTLRYLLGSLHDFVWQHDLVAAASLEPVDAWAIGEAIAMGDEVRRHFAACAFHLGMQRLSDFCNTFLSAIYLDALKDRLYVSGAHSGPRRSAQTALYLIARDLIRLLAPVLAFTADEAWTLLPGAADEAPSVHIGFYAGVDEPEALMRLRREGAARAASLSAVFAYARSVRRVANAALEAARQDKRIGSSTEAMCTIAVPSADAAVAARLSPAAWAEWLIVSHVALQSAGDAPQVTVTIRAAPGHKCERCWLKRQNTQAVGSAAHVCVRCQEVLAACPA